MRVHLYGARDKRAVDLHTMARNSWRCTFFTNSCPSPRLAFQRLLYQLYMWSVHVFMWGPQNGAVRLAATMGADREAASISDRGTDDSSIQISSERTAQTRIRKFELESPKKGRIDQIDFIENLFSLI